MSDLVANVMFAIVGNEPGADDKVARRAIAAVAEWLDTVMEDRVAASDLMKQLRDKS